MIESDVVKGGLYLNRRTNRCARVINAYVGSGVEYRYISAREGRGHTSMSPRVNTTFSGWKNFLSRWLKVEENA